MDMTMNAERLRIALALTMVMFTTTVWAEGDPAANTETDSSAEPVTQEPSRSQSGYNKIIQFGGPDSVSGQLRKGDEVRTSRYYSEDLQNAWEPYFDWKSDLHKDHGIAFSINTWLLYQNASDIYVAPGNTDPDRSKDDALGYIARFQGAWTFMGREGGSQGRIEWRVEQRGNVGGSNIAPATLGNNVGVVGLNTGFPYNEEFDLDLAVINWTQGLFDNRAGFAVGRLAFDAYLDANSFQTPAGGFLNRGLVFNPTLPTTGVGALGAVAETFVGQNVRVGGQIYDANAKNGNWDYDTFKEGEYIKALELAFVASQARHKTDMLQFTYWKTDRIDLTAREPGEGWVMTGTWKFANWSPFVKYGNSNGGGGTASEEYAAAGFKLKPAFDQTWSAGAAWSKPVPDLVNKPARRKDEYVFEVSYIYQVSKNFSLMPDIQYIKDPADNPQDNDSWILGLRAMLFL
jgi:porin